MASFNAHQAAPSRRWITVVGDDNAVLPSGARGIYVGTAGDLALMDDKGNTEIFVAAVGVLPVGPTRIMATGTTASDLVLLF